MAGRWRNWMALLATLGLGSCFSPGRTEAVMPTATVAAPRPARALVVVLPGRADDLAGLRASGIVEALQGARPDADVLLAGATLPYYLEGRLIERLHAIIAPARERYREIWLIGASMGGMGVLLYEHDHPRELDGLVLFAPYMGGGKLIQEVRAAGGPAQWEPGPRPATLADGNPMREEWRVVRDWAQRPQDTRRVWLVCGDDDGFVEAARMIAPLLPAGHYLERDGGHKWTVWSAAAGEVFARSAP
ncbi:alpha/beta hydrolase-fold protein [Solimonas soli]|uniref:alpha/beta hydrolase-fold protein n=1 Tax=Solimonas soli TaxID=413479 RepID=UPI0004826F83|nr:alpha/beta hydrolase [Solimonas soli]